MTNAKPLVVQTLNNSLTLLRDGEEALMFCFSCKLRIVKKSQLAATRAWRKHRRESGHDIGWITARNIKFKEDDWK
jgi:hypothetical protein